MNPDYALAQMKGVWKMAFNRKDWERSFDRSLDGVFGSFSAILWAVPVLLLNFTGLRSLFAAAPDLPKDALVAAPSAFWLASNFATFAVDWAVGLAALLAAARFLGAAARAGDAVIGYNWLQVFSSAAQSAPIAAGLLAGGSVVFSILMLPAIALTLALFWGVLRRGLGLAPGPSIGLAAAMMLLSLIVGEVCHTAALAMLGTRQ